MTLEDIKNHSRQMLERHPAIFLDTLMMHRCRHDAPPSASVPHASWCTCGVLQGNATYRERKCCGQDPFMDPCRNERPLQDWERLGSSGMINITVIPSCCVWRIRDKFPDFQGQYPSVEPGPWVSVPSIIRVSKPSILFILVYYPLHIYLHTQGCTQLCCM